MITILTRLLMNCVQYNGRYEDSIVIEADTIEELKEQAV